MIIQRTARAALFCVSLAALGACATAPAATPPDSHLATAPDAGDEGSSYGVFLAGVEAFDSGDKRGAADLFSQAADDSKGTRYLRERAFTAALMAGDVHQAALQAVDLDDSVPAVQRLGRLTRAVDALADGKGRQAQALLGDRSANDPFSIASTLLAPWAAASAGDWKAALTLPPPTGERLTDEIMRLDNALLLERHHRYAEAEAGFQKLLDDADGSTIFTSSYGAFLERRGRTPDAIALYQAALKGDSTNRLIADALTHAQSGKPAPPAPALAEGAAQALLGPAAVFLSIKQPELGLAYLQLILRLDPNRDEAWMLLGDTMVAQDDVDTARQAYGHLQAGSPDFVDARARLINTYDSPADKVINLQLAQDTVKAAPGDDDALAMLADALRANERYVESAKVLDQLIADQGDKAGWQIYYMRGVALQQAGRWDDAQADMQKALTLSPDQPDVLNYLGYSWIDRGERMPEAKAMIEKAVAAKPDSGAIVDSLGWAYFRMGDYAKAVSQLEHAAELDSADPEINDHLGDAYWRAGRRDEARFQWERVLTLAPDDKLRHQVEEKLRSGLAAANRVAEVATPAKP
jgi:tetratricopeptide (TPR) repeat protein